jgi:hypothetical protein
VGKVSGQAVHVYLRIVVKMRLWSRNYAELLGGQGFRPSGASNPEESVDEATEQNLRRIAGWAMFEAKRCKYS